MKILLADDDKNFGFILKSELEDEGYSVDLYSDGAEAVLGYISNPTYDFIILDIKMPRLDGINALRIIKKLNPDIPVVIFSGNVKIADMTNLLEDRSIRYFAKPFEIRVIKNEITKYISQRNQADAVKAKII